MTFIPSSSLRRRRSLVASFLALAWLCLPGALWAAECEAIDSDGLSRDCTALESLGQCMSDAMDSYDQCRSSRHFFWWWRCTEDAFIDLTACAAQSPFDAILR